MMLCNNGSVILSLIYLYSQKYSQANPDVIFLPGNGNMQHVKAMFLQSSANVYVYAAI